MVFTNAQLFLGEKGFVRGSFCVRNGRFCNVSTEEINIKEGCVDLQGLRVLPGLVDLHIHGCRGMDLSDGNLEGLHEIGRYLARRGVTAFAPTSMTLPLERLEAAFRTAAEYANNPPTGGARLIGIHMEGPYFSEKKKGAQNAAYLRLPDAAEVLSLIDKCGLLPSADEPVLQDKYFKSDFAACADKNQLCHSERSEESQANIEPPTEVMRHFVPRSEAMKKCESIEDGNRLRSASHSILRFVDIAPELPGAEKFIRTISKICKVSVAHTNASYEEAIRAFDAGASHVTHLFNGMPELLHREPGVVGAAFDRKEVTVELIGDGLHNHPSLVRMAFRLFPGRLCLVSDALRCTGMPDGAYELGGQKVVLAGGEARLPDGTLAGAATDLYEDLVRVIRFGVPETEAILAATKTPAIAAGVFDELGSLENGKRADFLVCDKKWNLRQAWIGGVLVP